MAKIRKIYDDAIKPDGSKQVIYPVTSTRAVYTTTNVTVDAILNEGYRFGGVVLPTDTPSILDQRSFYAASVPGVYTSFGNIAVNSGEAIFLMWDSVNWKKGIFASASFSTLTGFKALASISDLPLEETRFGYLINEHLYVWVGENGDTLDGKYLDCGELRGASAYEVAVRNGYTGSEQEWLQDPINGIKGISVQSVECIHEALEDGGTNIWRITLTNGQSTDFEVKNGNQGNSGYQGAAEELEVVNNLTDGGATAALSAEMGKAIVDLYGTYIENPEFVRVILDKEDRILMAIRNDGDIYFGVGCPSQVKDYVEEKLHEFSPEGYAEIVAFLEGELHSGKTLAQLLSEQDAKIVAEKERAQAVEATKANQSDVDSINRRLNHLNIGIDPDRGVLRIGNKMFKLIDYTGPADFDEDIDYTIFIEATTTLENPEWQQAITDSEDRLLYGKKQDSGEEYWPQDELEGYTMTVDGVTASVNSIIRNIK